MRNFKMYSKTDVKKLSEPELRKHYQNVIKKFESYKEFLESELEKRKEE